MIALVSGQHGGGGGIFVEVVNSKARSNGCVPPGEFAVTGDEAATILAESVSAAKAAGLGWIDKSLELKPAKELVKLIRESQIATATKETAEGE